MDSHMFSFMHSFCSMLCCKSHPHYQVVSPFHFCVTLHRINIPKFTYSTADGHLCCFQFLAKGKADSSISNMSLGDISSPLCWVELLSHRGCVCLAFRGTPCSSLKSEKNQVGQRVLWEDTSLGGWAGDAEAKPGSLQTPRRPHSLLVIQP